MATRKTQKRATAKAAMKKTAAKRTAGRKVVKLAAGGKAKRCAPRRPPQALDQAVGQSR